MGFDGRMERSEWVPLLAATGHGQAELARAPERYRRLLEAVPDVVLRLDASGRLLESHTPPGWQSPPCMKLSATSVLRELFPSPALEAIGRAVGEVLDGGRTEPVTFHDE